MFQFKTVKNEIKEFEKKELDNLFYSTVEDKYYVVIRPQTRHRNKCVPFFYEVTKNTYLILKQKITLK